MRLGVSERTVERMERSGRLSAAQQISDGRRGHRLSTIMAIIEATEERTGTVVIPEAEPFLFDAPLAVDPAGRRGLLGPSGRERVAHDRYLFHDPIGAT